MPTTIVGLFDDSTTPPGITKHFFVSFWLVGGGVLPGEPSGEGNRATQAGQAPVRFPSPMPPKNSIAVVSKGIAVTAFGGIPGH